MGGFEQTDGVMQRILMLLFALAGLAERAAQAPHPVRSRVLMILRIAEPAAQQAVLTNDTGRIGGLRGRQRRCSAAACRAFANAGVPLDQPDAATATGRTLIRPPPLRCAIDAALPACASACRASIRRECMSPKSAQRFWENDMHQTNACHPKVRSGFERTTCIKQSYACRPKVRSGFGRTTCIKLTACRPKVRSGFGRTTCIKSET